MDGIEDTFVKIDFSDADVVTEIMPMDDMFDYDSYGSSDNADMY